MKVETYNTEEAMLAAGRVTEIMSPRKLEDNEENKKMQSMTTNK